MYLDFSVKRNMRSVCTKLKMFDTHIKDVCIKKALKQGYFFYLKKK